MRTRLYNGILSGYKKKSHKKDFFRYFAPASGEFYIIRYF